MPGFNQQGPLGKGPMTGRAQGKCTNYGEKDALKNQNNENLNQQTDTEEIDGRGFGRRIGRGFAQGAGRGFGGNGQGFGGGGGRGRRIGRQNRHRGNA